MTLNSVMPMVRVLQAISVNKFIYYFKRIPLIGKMLPDASYGFGDIKVLITVIATIFKAIKQLAFKSIYIGVLAFLPAMLWTSAMQITDRAPYFVAILAALSIFVGMFNAGTLLQNSFEKYTCIKLMRMPSRQYMLSFCMLNQVTTFLGFLLPMVIFGAFAGLGIIKSILLTLMIIMAHTIGEAFNMWVFTKKKTNLSQKVSFMIVISIIGIALAYGPMFIAPEKITFWSGMPQVISTVVMSVPFILVEIILFVLSAKYIAKYSNYTWLASETIDPEVLATLQNPSKATGQTRFRDVNLKDGDFTKSIMSSKIAGKKGYDYLNAVFFERHKRMLTRPVEAIILIVAGSTVVGAMATLIWYNEISGFVRHITGILPFCVFGMYFVTTYSSERACRAMFNNCDISLLRYSFYREPKDILRNFWIRLKMICKMNIAISVAICVFVAVLAGVSGATWSILDEGLFMLSVICIGLFFSVHHLFLYYVFQPYTTDLGMKNPIFSILNIIVYMACFMCLQLDANPKSFTVIVLVATTIYVIGALILVRLFAPKNFRVK